MSDINIEYLKPKSNVILNQHSKYYIKSGCEAQIVRNIYEKVDYDDYELKLIEELKSQCQEQLPNKYFDCYTSWKMSDYLKMLVSADFQISTALKNIKHHLNWLMAYKNLHPNISILESGNFYIFGIDKQARPIIIIKQLEENNFNTFLFLLETIKRQVLVPYFIENWTIIIDLQNKDIDPYDSPLDFSNLQVLMINFVGNLNIILIINCTLTFKEVVSLIPKKNQIHQKIKILQNIDGLKSYIHSDQLEMQYGGLCNNVVAFWQINKLFRATISCSQQLVVEANYIRLSR